MSEFLKTYGECTTALGFPSSEEIARDLDKRLETGEWSPIRVGSHVESTAAVSKDSGEQWDISVVNDDTIDKDKEIILPKGLNWDHSFRKNPVVVFSHNYGIPPVGKSIWQKLIGNTWKAKTQYIKRPKEHPTGKEWFPSTVFHLVKEGGLPGKSIGGITKWRDANSEESQNGIKRVGEETLVYEYSCVPLQSNNNAIVQLVSKGLVTIDEDTIQKFFPDVWDDVKEVYEEAEEEEVPIIKEFVTAEDYKRQKKNQLEERLNSFFTENTEELVENTIKRMLGRVS